MAQRDTRIREPAPGISAVDAARTEPGIGPAHVIAGMRRLHRGNHPEFEEALDVLMPHNLGMLDPQPRVGRLGKRLARGGIGVEHQGICLVPDRVCADLPSILEPRP